MVKEKEYIVFTKEGIPFRLQAYSIDQARDLAEELCSEIGLHVHSILECKKECDGRGNIE